MRFPVRWRSVFAPSPPAPAPPDGRAPAFLSRPRRRRRVRRGWRDDVSESSVIGTPLGRRRSPPSAARPHAAVSPAVAASFACFARPLAIATPPRLLLLLFLLLFLLLLVVVYPLISLAGHWFGFAIPSLSLGGASVVAEENSHPAMLVRAFALTLTSEPVLVRWYLGQLRLGEARLAHLGGLAHGDVALGQRPLGEGLGGPVLADLAVRSVPLTGALVARPADPLPPAAARLTLHGSTTSRGEEAIST
ncbi:hypothetical protein EYF80_047094 [Liparis tanakae]|uniref:Uncharacterized protein n=1 Tax=Liparis tanakae TaxID=230148 RepID=A0A4Z2FNT2_9TELE|nr:hypothetical protein EYF80_047094 [Liparis tanakae]